MKLNEILTLLEYKHRADYHGNKKGSYINKGKTYWDYSEGQKVGTERLTTQIQDKARKQHDVYLSRREIKRYLESESSQKLFNKVRRSAINKVGTNEKDPDYKRYVYGGFCTAATNVLVKGKKKGVTYLL